MGFNEFKELWAALNAWKQNFMTIDQDQSGTVEHHELSQAIALMGKTANILYNLLDSLVKKWASFIYFIFIFYIYYIL